MPALKKTRKSPNGALGLDVDSGYLAAVQVSQGSVVRAVSTDLPPGVVREGEIADVEELKSALKAFFRERKLPRRVRLGIANQQIAVRHLETPKIDDPGALEAAIRFQAAEAIAMPLEEAIVDHQVVGEGLSAEGRPILRVLVVAARASMIERFVEAVRGAGLRPEGIDLSAFALVRTLSTGSRPEEGVKVLCHLGGTTNLAIALTNSCLFTRPLSTSWEDEGDHVGTALAEEIRISIDFYMSQPDAVPVECVRLTGPGARREGLVEELLGPVGLPVSVAEPLGAMPLMTFDDGEDPARHTVAAGLALGATA